jgi:hypothetical protein
MPGPDVASAWLYSMDMKPDFEHPALNVQFVIQANKVELEDEVAELRHLL